MSLQLFLWGCPVACVGHRQHFKSFTLQGVEYSIGDAVLLESGGVGKPFVARLVDAFRDPSAEEEHFIRVQWYERANSLDLGTEQQEVVELEETDCNPLGCIAGKCIIVPAENWSQAQAMASKFPGAASASEVFFSQGLYNPETNTLHKYSQLEGGDLSCQSKHPARLPSDEDSTDMVHMGATDSALPSCNKRCKRANGGGGACSTVKDEAEDAEADGAVEQQQHPEPPAGRCCTLCGASQTPQWREGPCGKKTLCNACGVRRVRKQQRTSSNKSNASAARSPKGVSKPQGTALNVNTKPPAAPVSSSRPPRQSAKLAASRYATFARTGEFPQLEDEQQQPSSAHHPTTPPTASTAARSAPPPVRTQQQQHTRTHHQQQHSLSLDCASFLSTESVLSDNAEEHNNCSGPSAAHTLLHDPSPSPLAAHAHTHAHAASSSHGHSHHPFHTATHTAAPPTLAHPHHTTHASLAACCSRSDLACMLPQHGSTSSLLLPSTPPRASAAPSPTAFATAHAATAPTDAAAHTTGVTTLTAATPAVAGTPSQSYTVPMVSVLDCEAVPKVEPVCVEEGMAAVPAAPVRTHDLPSGTAAATAGAAGVGSAVGVGVRGVVPGAAGMPLKRSHKKGGAKAARAANAANRAAAAAAAAHAAPHTSQGQSVGALTRPPPANTPAALKECSADFAHWEGKQQQQQLQQLQQQAQERAAAAEAAAAAARAEAHAQLEEARAGAERACLLAEAADAALVDAQRVLGERQEAAERARGEAIAAALRFEHLCEFGTANLEGLPQAHTTHGRTPPTTAAPPHTAAVPHTTSSMPHITSSPPPCPLPPDFTPPHSTAPATLTSAPEGSGSMPVSMLIPPPPPMPPLALGTTHLLPTICDSFDIHAASMQQLGGSAGGPTRSAPPPASQQQLLHSQCGFPPLTGMGSLGDEDVGFSMGSLPHIDVNDGMGELADMMDLY